MRSVVWKKVTLKENAPTKNSVEVTNWSHEFLFGTVVSRYFILELQKWHYFQSTLWLFFDFKTRNIAAIMTQIWDFFVEFKEVKQKNLKFLTAIVAVFSYLVQ